MPAEWKIWTWTDYWNDCRKFAKALITLKVEKFGVVNIMGFNSVTPYLICRGANSPPTGIFYIHSRASAVRQFMAYHTIYLLLNAK